MWAWSRVKQSISHVSEKNALVDRAQEAQEDPKLKYRWGAWSGSPNNFGPKLPRFM